MEPWQPLNDAWWELPGPAGFVQGMVDDLRDGRNVVVCLPDHAPDGLITELRGQATSAIECPWTSLQLHHLDGEAPGDLLFSRLVGDPAPDSVRSAGVFSRTSEVAGHCICLDGMGAEVWPCWRGFVEEYSHACRSRPVLLRALFVVVLRGATAHQAPNSDQCLAIHTWRGVVDSLDMQLYASSLIRQRRDPRLLGRVAASVVAEVAAYDPEVVSLLTSASFAEMIEPHDLLLAMARERKWLGAESPAWEDGSLDIVEGRPRHHPAWLAARSDRRELVRRVWRGQVGVLLPHVEEERQHFVDQLSKWLSVPYETRFGEVITDLRDLEIGHIESQVLELAPRFDPLLRRRLRRLREIRNRLAHMEPVGTDLLDLEESVPALGETGLGWHHAM